MNATITDYRSPNVAYLTEGEFKESEFAQLLKNYARYTPVALVKILWFDNNHPENQSVVFEGIGLQTKIYKDGAWEVNNKLSTAIKLREAAYDIAAEICSKNTLDKRLDCIAYQISSNKYDNDCIKDDNKNIEKLLTKKGKAILIINDMGVLIIG